MPNLVIGKNVTVNVRLLQVVLAEARSRTALVAARRFNANEYILKRPLALPMPWAFDANILEICKIDLNCRREIHTFCVNFAPGQHILLYLL